MPHRQPLITAAAAIAIVAVTMLAYIPGMHGGFIWDDDAYVTENANLRSLDGLVDIWTRPRSIPQYYPLVHTTYWLEYHAWGAQPAGYKIVNAALHALAALMLWRVLRRLAVPGAWLAAVLFAIHPVQVESVTWITERKNVLSSLMYFASFYCALRWLALDRPAAQPPDHHPSPDKLHRWYILAGLLFLGALLSKTVTCSLPAAVLLVVWWKRGRIQRREVLGMAPFFLVGFVFAMVTAQLERHHVGALGEDWALGLLDRTLIASRAVFFYLAKLAWPTDLSFIYPRWRIDTTAWQQYLPIVLLAVLAALLILRRRQLGRGPIVIALLYLGTLLPALGFFNIYPMRYTFVADHYQYLASAAVFTAIAAVLSRGLVRLRLAPRSAACLAVAIVLAILFARTWDRQSAYQSLRTLWADTLDKNPTAWLAWHNLGNLHFADGRLDEAAAHYQRAIALKADYELAHLGMGNVDFHRGELDAAADRYERVLAMTSSDSLAERADAIACRNLGLIAGHRGQYDRAIQWLSKAVAIDPAYVDAHYNLALAHHYAGHRDQALSHADIALRLAPDHAPAKALRERIDVQGDRD